MVQLLDGFYFNPITDFLLLILLGIANTMPIVARHIFKEKFSTPIDFNKSFFDNRPILGTHKTWRGFFSSIIVTSLVAEFIGYGIFLGIELSFYSMCGDLLASFIKRRLNLRSGAKLLGIDQCIEAFLPLFVLKEKIFISWLDCLVITFIFFLVEISLSPILYRLGFRRNPY